MIKLLIVDDEQIERDGMEAILNKAFPELIIEQAKNGKIAVELAGVFNPDVILMDIKMPGMNGLEAVERISKEYPNTKFIMVTAYDTFDYIKSAMKFGAKDYLLKPSKVSEIKDTIGRVVKEIKEEKQLFQARKLQRETLQKTLAIVETDVVTQLLFDHVHEVHVDMLVEMLDIRSTNQMFVINVIVPIGLEHVYSKIKEKVRQTKAGWMGALYDGQLPIILFRDPERSFRSQAVSLAREILAIANIDELSGWFVGIGNVCETLEQIRQSYQESLVASVDPTLPIKYRFYSDVPISSDGSNGQNVKHQKKECSDLVRLGHWEQVRMNVMNFIQSYENEGLELLQVQQSVLEVLWVTWSVMSEMGIETATPLYPFQTQNYRQLRVETGNLIDQMRQSYEKHYDSLEADAIQQIKQYIMDHSHQDISLDALGKKVRLSPIYISKMFKEKLGINYIDFLTECRIEKAKKLMVDPEKSIKEITFEVGYHEPNYFSKVFKKMCNVSPKAYRNTLLGKKD